MSFEQEQNETTLQIPEEFKKIAVDFVGDIVRTFPEYEPIVNKWWNQPGKDELLFQHCLKVYPERFFDILYQNVEIFNELSNVNTDFLPGISFKYLWASDISDKTKETIWKYLQLIAVSLVGSIDNKNVFGDAENLFDKLNQPEFKEKLQETLSSMQNLFDNKEEAPNVDDIHERFSGMMNGKLGNLAKEIAEEAAENFQINAEDPSEILQSLFQNPAKVMGLVNNVKEKLENK
jgi:hypothetical protein